MKDQILKIAKVKSEKEFYKKYPTEEAFMAKHGKQLKKAEMGAKMVNTQLHQLTDFSNPPVAQAGIHFADRLDAMKQYMDKSQQVDLPQKESTLDSIMKVTSQLGDVAATASSSSDNMQDGGLMNIGNMIGSSFGKQGGLGSTAFDLFGGKGTAESVMKGGQDLFSGGFKSGMSKLGTSEGLGAAGKAAGLGLLNAAPQILQGVGQMKQQKANIKKAEQASQISGVTAAAAESKPVGVEKHKFVRPEDALVQPGQLGSPTGVGTNYLSAQDGAIIGGNPTEIQNTYNPGNLYMDLGYEPLNDSNPKQFQFGGDIPTAEFGDYFQSSGQASIGKGVGSAIGSAFLGPIGGAVGGFLGGVAGNLFGGAKDANRLAAFQDTTRRNTERAAIAGQANALHTQYSSNMAYGGAIDSEHKWVSNGWQPQVITTFGEHKLKDLLKPPYDADMLRSGGHLKEDYVQPSAEALFTGKSMAMGGELQTHWGGKAEPISYNPYLPGEGETVMFKGQSHDETDGKGRSGIGVTYGNNPVEVERNEPAVKLGSGGNEENLVVFGDMFIPKYGINEIGDDKAVGKKFKHYVADLSKVEAKQNKTVEKATELVNSVNSNNAFDQLAMNSGKAMLMGANTKLKDIADKKEAAARVQNAILDTAKEYGYEDSSKFNEDVMKGKVKQAKFGTEMNKAQSGKEIVSNIMSFLPNTGTDVQVPYDPNYLPEVTVTGHRKKQEPVEWPDLPGAFTPDQIAKGKEKGVDWKDAAGMVLGSYPFFRPTGQTPLDPSQTMGEMYALATNQPTDVKAQLYQPMLDQPYDISLQDQLNSVDSQSRAAIRAAGQDPAAQAYIMSQAAEAKNKVLGEQMRINQAQKAQVYAKNREALNQAQMQNLGILDTQYVRQETAKSKTKAETLAALQSIGSKIAQNKLENKQLGVMENMYNFRFDDKGRAYNVNPMAQFNVPSLGITDPSLVDNAPAGTVPIYDNKGKITGYKVVEEAKAKTAKKRNGSIVKAIKNL